MNEPAPVLLEYAVLADSHVTFGMIAGGGGSQRLPRIVGLPRALGHVTGAAPARTGES